MPKHNREVKNLLRRVREKVVSTHWIKGIYVFQQEGGKVCGCLVGLVNIEGGLPPSKIGGCPPYFRRDSQDDLVVAQALELLFKTINASRSKHPVEDLESWNDRASRRRSEVVALLDECIAA